MFIGIHSIFLNEDCIAQILNLPIKNGFDYKSIIFTCKLFSMLLSSKHKYYIREFSDHFKTLIKFKGYPSKMHKILEDLPGKYLKWDEIKEFLKYNIGHKYELLNYNAYMQNIIPNNINITWDIVSQNPTIGWYSFGFLNNPNVSLKFLEDNLLLLKYHDFCENPNITLEFAIKHINESKIWKEIQGGSRCINDKTILDNKNIKWNLFYLSQNPHVSYKTLEYLCDILGKSITKIELDWDRISLNKYLTTEDVSKNIYLPWTWHNIISNAGISWGFINDNMDFIRTFCVESSNELDLPDHRDLYYNISKRSDSLTCDYIEKGGEKLKKFWKTMVTHHSNIDLVRNFIEKILHRQISDDEWFESIIYRSKLTWDILINCPENIWNKYGYLYLNGCYYRKKKL